MEYQHFSVRDMKPKDVRDMKRARRTVGLIRPGADVHSSTESGHLFHH